MKSIPMEGLDDWNPGPGGVDPESKKAALFSTEAHDSAETMNGVNVLKRAVGKKTPHKPPFGTRGQMF